ncbi:MAG: hypothetical protein WCG26_05710 [Chloroflexales bacterium]
MRLLLNDPDTSRAIPQVGMAIIPDIGLEDSIETAMWAHAARPEQFAGFVVDVSTDGRVSIAAMRRRNANPTPDQHQINTEYLPCSPLPTGAAIAPAPFAA